MPINKESLFNGKCVLDFGCGYGASALVMAAMLPDAEFVGIELDSVKGE